jgi:NRPS condensation-like uncharacterized protein
VSGPCPATWPFTPVEELDAYLENAHEPSLVQFEIHSRARLEEAALAEALGQVLAADPAARRRLAATSRWRRHLHWQVPATAGPAPGRRCPGGSGAAALTVASWDSAGELAALRERVSGWPMRLRDTAVRVVLATGPGHDVVILQTHHAAFDGISTLALLGALCAAYRDRSGQSRVPAPKPARVPAPGPAREPAPGPAREWVPGPAREPAPGPALGATGKHPVAAGPGGRPWHSLLPGATARICAQPCQPGRPGYGHVLRSVPVPRPARAGSGAPVTVNDVLVAAVILAVDRWNAAHGHRGGRVRISVPVSTRDPQRRWEGAGNQTRLIRVSAPPRHRAAPSTLLTRVTAQTVAGKQRPRPGLDAASRLLATGWAPVAVKSRTARLARHLAGPVCTDTALVSNLGVVPDPPSFSGWEEPVWFSGPAPMPRGLSVGALTVAGRLHVCVRYRYALLGQAAADAFTDACCQAMSELAGVTPGGCRG